MAPPGRAPPSPPVRPSFKRSLTLGTIDVRFVGLEHSRFEDLYYDLIRASWWRLMSTMVGLFLVLNALFAVVYLVFGGVDGARDGNFADAFFFSVQTMATIGYGAMHPRTPLANVLVTAEALTGLLGVAMATGVLFAKFARPIGRLVFSKVACVSPRDGVPSLMFRVANARANHVMEATMKVTVIHDETTVEGEHVRRWYDLPLVRNSSPIFALSWTAVHPIDEKSRLFGQTSESLAATHAEIIVTLWGTDATLAATIYARYAYLAEDIRFGARFVDIVGFDEAGRRIVDMRKFHDTVPVGYVVVGAAHEDVEPVDDPDEPGEEDSVNDGSADASPAPSRAADSRPGSRHRTPS